MKTVKSRLFKKYFKRSNSRTRFFPLVGYMSVQTIIKNCNSVGAGAHKMGKIVLGPTFILIFPIFRERKIDKLCILKKVGLNTL